MLRGLPGGGTVSVNAGLFGETVVVSLATTDVAESREHHAGSVLTETAEVLMMHHARALLLVRCAIDSSKVGEGLVWYGLIMLVLAVTSVVCKYGWRTRVFIVRVHRLTIVEVPVETRVVHNVEED